MAKAMSHSMMHMSMLARQELRIFQGFVSRFDSLSKARVKCGGSEGTRTRDLLRDRQARYHNKNAGLESREPGTPREIACRFDLAFTRLRRRFFKTAGFMSCRWPI